MMSREDFEDGMEVMAKIRYNHKGALCRIYHEGEDKLRCVFNEPQRAVTPGQAVVLYEGDFVLGGGTILC
jgi:tRNA-specific 2-thiouridylase